MSTANSKAKPALSIVGQPDLEAMERVVKEAAEQTAPIVSRAVSLQNEQIMARKKLVSERGEFEDRKDLLNKQYEAAIEGLDAHIADIDAALLLLPPSPSN